MRAARAPLFVKAANQGRGEMVNIFAAFDDAATLGQVVDRVGALGGEMWFRGESIEYRIPAYPALARQAAGGGLDMRPIEGDYSDASHTFPLRVLTRAERDITERFKANPPADPYFRRLLSSPDHPGWLALARHWGEPTRLLDVTRDLFVALYFACSADQDKDGFIFVFFNPANLERNNPLRCCDYRDLYDAALGDSIPAYREHEKAHPGTLQQHAPKLVADRNSEGGRARRDMIYLFECKEVINERMAAQRGAFIWRGDPTCSLLGETNQIVLKVAAGAKSRIEQRLNVLGINRQTLCL